MKPITKLICLLIAWLVFVSPSRGNAVYEEAINKFSTEPSQENLIQLAGHLRGIARHQKSYQESEYYSRIQKLIVSTPGHARYFADEIERVRDNVAHLPRNNQIDYDRIRLWYFKDLFQHLPSPEMIRVLGEMLHDHREPPTTRVMPPDNANYAAYTLSRMGLRDVPFGEIFIPIQQSNFHEIVDSTKEYDLFVKDVGEQPNLVDFQNWWKEVRAGERTFSFKGQGVEYRFSLDGSWVTIPIANPPDDGLRSEESPHTQPTREADAAPTQSTAQDPLRSTHIWIWFLIAGLLISTFLGWKIFCKK